MKLRRFISFFLLGLLGLVFSATRKVKVNWAYSVNQFINANWKEVLTVVIGSGSLASLATWWISRKDKKKSQKPEDKSDQSEE